MKKQLSLFALVCLLCVSFSFAQTREIRNVSTFTKIAFRVPGKLYLRQGAVQKVEIEGKKDVLKEIETEVSGGKLVVGKEGSWSNWSWGDNDDDAVNVYITVKDIEALSVSGSGDLIGETKFTTGDLDLNVSGSGSLKIEVDASGDLEADVSGSGDIDLKGKCKSFNSDVSGSGKVMMSVSVSEKADFGVSGSGRIMASGSAEKVKASISGSGKVLASDLVTNSCEVRISGSGDVEINVKTELDANISGSGTVSYKGNPSKVNSHSSGSGKVSKM
ncbi:MAG TPA: head GIN domain-containing protein [Chryseolinea sp.]|nr:head GIN domain-containing protein [Chryseolinea sp.]HPH45978.1 head GIN domain-containing protein [Chryseolinea sp.]HPM29809.1 head GIN domain-containing protein [Chryseolinea sp.]